VRPVALATAMMLLLGGLTGCASRTESYCSAMKHDQAQLQRLASSSDHKGRDVLGQSLVVFKDLQSKSPDDIAPDWDTFVYAWSGLTDALHAAGVDPATFRPGRKPAGVSTGEYRAITQAASELGSAKVLDAAHRIEDHASSVCKVDLAGSALS
jgi:hypothetical protein